MFESLREGGWAIAPTALFGVLCLLAAVRYAVRPREGALSLPVALGVVTLALGALGFVSGLIKSARALGDAPTGKVGQLFAVGFGESLPNVALALAWISAAALVVSIGAARRAPVGPRATA
jgi:hypothetical protein